MGFTPNSGVVMGTRSGDIDYGIIKYMMKTANMTFVKFLKMKKSKTILR